MAKIVIGYFDGAIKGRIYAVDCSGHGEWVEFVTGKNAGDPKDEKIYFLVLDVILPATCVDFVKSKFNEIAAEKYPGKEIEMIEEGMSVKDMFTYEKD